MQKHGCEHQAPQPSSFLTPGYYGPRCSKGHLCLTFQPYHPVHSAKKESENTGLWGEVERPSFFLGIHLCPRHSPRGNNLPLVGAALSLPSLLAIHRTLTAVQDTRTGTDDVSWTPLQNLSPGVSLTSTPPSVNCAFSVKSGHPNQQSWPLIQVASVLPSPKPQS